MANSQTPIDFSQLNLPHSPIPGATAPTGNQAQVIDPNASVKQVDEALKQLSDIVYRLIFLYGRQLQGGGY